MEAFEIYKSEGGSELNRILKENKSVLKERLTQMNNLTGNINSIKWDIDHMKIELQLYKEQRQGLYYVFKFYYEINQYLLNK